MSSWSAVPAWLLSFPPLQRRLRRGILEQAAQQLAPERQAFSTGDEAVASMLQTRPVTAYLHVPFCSAACGYCIFRKTTRTGLMDGYLDAVRGEIDLYAAEPLLAGHRISSLHIGGGTPSLVPTERLAELIQQLDRRLGLSPGAQVTLEGNPESLPRAEAERYRAAGIDRISIGVQSLDDALLREMGRQHTGASALACIHDLQDTGFANLSVDLMYGFEGQASDRFLEDVDRVVQAGVPHLSAFPLVQRPGTEEPAAQRAREEQRRRCYRGLVSGLEAAGYTQYSSEDFALQPQHENSYQVDAWRFPRRDVLGLGAGSLGSLAGHYTTNHAQLDRYRASIAAGKLPIARLSSNTRAQQMRRSVLLGAKYMHIGRQDFVDEYGIPMEAALEPLLSRFRWLGIWTVDAEGIHLTSEGLQLVSEIWSELILANLAAAAKGAYQGSGMGSSSTGSTAGPLSPSSTKRSNSPRRSA